MNAITTIILPGLDGTDLLLGPFCELAPRSLDATVHPLPDDPKADYVSLCDHFSKQIRRHESVYLIAESFSGPLGILLAHRHPDIIKRLILVATFAVSPVWPVARLIPWSVLFRLPLPNLVARNFLVGSDSSQIDELKRAVRQTSPRTLVQRMHCLMNVDVTRQFTELKCDLLYLRPKQDRIVSLRALDTITKANSSISVCEIDGPHLILQTEPQRAWDCIIDQGS